MGAVIQITNIEWTAITERAIERAGESLNERERAAVKAFIELAEPHIESIQIELLREPMSHDFHNFEEV